MIQFKNSAIGVSIAFAAILLFAYQNCSSTHFTSDLEGANLKAEDIAGSTDRAEGDDGNTGVPSGDSSQQVPPESVPGSVPSDTNVVMPSPSATPSVPPMVEDPKGNGNGNGNGKKDDVPVVSIPPGSTPPVSDSPVASTPPGKGNAGGKKDVNWIPPGLVSAAPDLVECQMLHPNKKVVLEYQMEVQHSNASSIRICMSTNACLKLINEFAVKHSCSLDGSAPAAAADAQAQCTEIFPGSRGTCKNATILSDDQVVQLLKKLEPAPVQPAPAAQ